MTTLNTFLKPVFQKLYETYYQELVSEELGKKWKKRDDITSIIVAITTPTTSGSAVVVWKIWETPIGQIIWGIIAFIVSILTIVHNQMKVPDQVQKQEEIRQRFLKLRTKIETLSDRINLGLIDINQTQQQFNEILEEYQECMRNTRSNEKLYDEKFRKKIKKRVEDELKRKGWPF